VLEAWAQWEPPGEAPAWRQADCHERWRAGAPLLAGTPLPFDAPDVEQVFTVAMEAVTATRPEEAASMRRLADAWDDARVDIAALLPARGGLGDEAARRLEVAASTMAFLAYAGLRPAVEWAVREARAHLVEGTWSLGICPFCGARR
jgi:hypothetical protein